MIYIGNLIPHMLRLARRPKKETAGRRTRRPLSIVDLANELPEDLPRSCQRQTQQGQDGPQPTESCRRTGTRIGKSCSLVTLGPRIRGTHLGGGLLTSCSRARLSGLYCGAAGDDRLLTG